MDEQRARELLQAERERLERIRDDELLPHLTQSQSDSTSELSSFDQHPGDVATETHDRSRDESILENVRAQLRDIEDAFARLDNGTYGVCEATGEQIPDERLETMPAARYTVEAQADMERRSRSGTEG
jgi:DnaK suppressor protein